MSGIKKIALDGFWKQNAGLVQLLGLCPTLAVTTSVINGLSLGIATAIVMAISNGSVSPIRKFIPSEIRVPTFVLIIASLVTIIDFSIHAFIQPLYKALGIFIPLIVTNCIVLARVESFAAKNETIPSFFDGLFMGFGLTMVLVLLGALREFFGKGTLFSGIDLILGPSANNLVIHFFSNYHGFLLAILPPGAFIALACLIALKNYIEAR